MKKICLLILALLLMMNSASADTGKVYPLVFRTEAPVTDTPTQEVTEAPATMTPVPEDTEEITTVLPVAEEEPEILPEPDMTAEEEEAAEERKTGGRLADGTYRLPLDLTPGMKLHKANYNTKYHYQDPTIEMDTRDEKNGEYRYWIAEIKIQDASQLRTMPANSFTRSNTAEGIRLSHRAQAVLACNGDYWYRDVQWKGSYVLRQGQLYMYHLYGNADLLLVNEDGDFRIIHKATEETTPMPKKKEGPVFYEGKQIYNGFCFGPALVEDGKALPIEPNDQISTEKKTARMAICQLGKLHYAVVCSAKESMTLQEFADMLSTMDIQTAYNLDGGNSTMLMTGDDLLNYNPTTRELSDIIYFASAWQGEDK